MPLFRFGVLTALGLGGAELSTPQELSEWLATKRGVLVYTVSGSSGEALPPSVVHSPGIDTVAVLETFTITRAADLLRAGAANVVDRAATAAEFRRVVADTRGGQVTVSAEVLSAAISAPRRPQSHLEITDEELSWLRELADGKGRRAFDEALDAIVAYEARRGRLLVAWWADELLVLVALLLAAAGRDRLRSTFGRFRR